MKQVVGTDRITRWLLITDWIVMAVVMRMPVIGLRGDGVLDVVKVTHRPEDRLEQHAEHHGQEQSVEQNTAVAAKAVHGRSRLQA